MSAIYIVSCDDWIDQITANVLTIFKVAFVGFGIDMKPCLCSSSNALSTFLKETPSSYCGQKCGTKCVKKGIVEMLFGAPETRVTNTTFRDKTMDVRIPF